MRCLYCGKPIKEPVSGAETEHGWHSRCIRAFFGTTTMPILDISADELDLLANAAVKEGLTVPGVQKKLSLHLSQEELARLTLVDYPTGYILKQQTEEFEALPEAEDLCMRLARAAGIQTVPHALVKIRNHSYAYITKRIDRNIEAKSDMDDCIEMYAMEDFCQLGLRLTQDKYRGSYERCAKIIQTYSDRPGLDLSELFLRIAFSFVTGNSDMHLKNFSLIEKNPAMREFILAPAYDLLPVNVIMPEDDEELALTLNGKKRNIRRKDFLVFAESCGLPRQSGEKILKKLVSLAPTFLQICEESYLPDTMKERMKTLIVQRIDSII